MTALMGLDVAGRRVLVAGGGAVAARRVSALVAEGALVTVVAPRVCGEVAVLHRLGLITWHCRGVVEADVDGAWLVHAATDDAERNALVCEWATSRRVWSVCASAVDRGSARTPAVVHHGGVAVGVVSHDEPNPVRVKQIRDWVGWLLRHGAVRTWEAHGIPTKEAADVSPAMVVVGESA